MVGFTSTRGAHRASTREALFRGLAEDGGLFVPEEVGSLAEPPPGLGPEFADTAAWAAPALVPDVPDEQLGRAARSACSFPLPLVAVEPDVHVLELFHGPTYAFKDVGARFMARLMMELEDHDVPGSAPRTVLVATSGDTGGAVAHAFAGLPGVRVVTLFPLGGISERQRRQMTTLGGNVLALGVRGTFDDCQRLAKSAFLDSRLSAQHRLTSANSINVGRLLPQALYYVHAARRLGWAERPARFVVPCGNLGNLCAGLLAHRAGMPAAGFVAATNVNDVFVEYLDTGRADARRPQPTWSSAMDVGDPSNLERIEWLYRSDPDGLRKTVTGVAVSDTDTRSCIEEVYARTGYVLDPHTAVAYHAHRTLAAEPGEPTVVLATAHAAKFPEVVESAIGRELPLPEGLAAVLDAEEHMEEIAPESAELAAALRRGASG